MEGVGVREVGDDTGAVMGLERGEVDGGEGGERVVEVGAAVAVVEERRETVRAVVRCISSGIGAESAVV